MNKIILIGAGGHAESCVDVIESTKLFTIVGFIDRNRQKGEKFLGYPVLGDDSEIADLASQKEYQFLITIGQIKTPQPRIGLFNLLQKYQVKLATVISPRAYLSPRAEIGPGTILLHDSIVNSGAKIGENCIINTKSLVEHNTIVESHCHIATGAIVNGNCHISQGTFIGSGAVLKQTTSVGPNSLIQANIFYSGKS